MNKQELLARKKEILASLRRKEVAKEVAEVLRSNFDAIEAKLSEPTLDVEVQQVLSDLKLLLANINIESGNINSFTESFSLLIKNLKIAKGEPGKDAKEVDLDALKAEILELLPAPKKGKDGKDGKDGETKVITEEKELAAEQIRDKLETLEGEGRLDAKAIKNLRKYIIDNTILGGGGSGGATTLSGLTDTNITSPTNDQIIKYDDATGKWVNATGSGGGGGAVDSVNGQTGVVVLDTDDVSEGATNLYYTDARVSANTDVTANTAARHNRQHAIDSTDDHTSTITSGKNIIADVNGLPSEGTNTNAEIAGAVTNSHVPVTVTDSSNIDLTLAGQDITGDLTDTTVVAGSYTNTDITVDAKGRITAAANGTGGTGDVVGPASATDNAITRFDSTTGKLIQNSNVTISDTGVLNIAGEFEFPIVDGTDGQVLRTDGANSLAWQDDLAPIQFGGRLTPTSGTPVIDSKTTTEVKSGTLYYTPYLSNQATLYNSTLGYNQVYTFNELEIDVTALTTEKAYDVFLYDNAGTVDIETLVWTDANTRATGITMTDGIMHKVGDQTRAYVGSFYTITNVTPVNVVMTYVSSGTANTAPRLYIFNYYNRVATPMVNYEDGSWVSTTVGWRRFNNSNWNQFRVMSGVDEDAIIATGKAWATSGTSSASYGFKINAITGTPESDLGFTSGAGMIHTSISTLFGGVGINYLQLMEYNLTGANITWAGDFAASTYFQPKNYAVYYC